VILIFGVSNSSNCDDVDCLWRSFLYCKPFQVQYFIFVACRAVTLHQQSFLLKKPTTYGAINVFTSASAPSEVLLSMFCFRVWHSWFCWHWIYKLSEHFQQRHKTKQNWPMKPVYSFFLSVYIFSLGLLGPSPFFSPTMEATLPPPKCSCPSCC